MSDEIKTPISDSEVAEVSGGAGDYRMYAKGKYVVQGAHALYTIAAGDALAGIAIKFGTTPEAIMRSNPTKIKNINTIIAGQQIVIYHTHIW